VKLLALLALVALAIAVPGRVGASAATFTAVSANPDQTFSTAADFNTVAVAMTDPGSPLRGLVALSATASSDRGIASVTFEVAPSGGGTWTTACTASAAPYTCNWSTTGVADGMKDVRAVALDTAGYSRIALVTARRVDNTAPAVTMSDPGSPLRGGVTLASTSSDTGSGVASVRYEYRTTPSGTWTTACTAASAPFSCSWATSGVTDGGYDLRATATDAAGNAATSAVVSSRTVDNTGPAGVSLTDPGSPLSGTVALSGAAGDALSGVASVRLQYALAGTTSWSDICVRPAAPYSCSWATGSLTDGLYDMRALATDNAGNTTASATVAARRVDNNAPSLNLTDPGRYLRGQFTAGATASDAGGIQSVVFQFRLPAGAWSTICTVTTAPYTCPIDTTTVPDGTYDAQAIATDNAGRTTTQQLLGLKVDNTAPTAVDVQGANGGTARKLDKGDTLTFTYGETMDPASVLAGWNGASTSVTVKVSNGATADTLSVWDAAGTTRLGLTSPTQDLKLNQSWVSANVTYTAKIAQSGANVIVTFDTPSPSNKVSSNVTGTVPMAWTPSTAATDLAGNPCAATAATESGTADVDF
jgi:hypothetical protein